MIKFKLIKIVYKNTKENYLYSFLKIVNNIDSLLRKLRKNRKGEGTNDGKK